MKTKKFEIQNLLSYHYVFVGMADFAKVFKDLAQNLPYYRLAYEGKIFEKEVFYDVPENLLSSAGLILSKWYNKGNIYFNIGRLNADILANKRRPAKKFLFGPCEALDEPRHFSLQIASAIEHSFSSPFSVDLDSIVKQTTPRTEILIEADRYQIICGTGYRASMDYEKTTYTDVVTGKKVTKLGVTFNFPFEERDETDEILRVIDRKAKGLANFEMSRYELAQKLLSATNNNARIQLVLDDQEDDGEK